jgi:hypothetical protein
LRPLPQGQDGFRATAATTGKERIHGDGSAGDAGGRATGGGNFRYSTGQVIMVDGGLTIPRL